MKRLNAIDYDEDKESKKTQKNIEKDRILELQMKQRQKRLDLNRLIN